MACPKDMPRSSEKLAKRRQQKKRLDAEDKRFKQLPTVKRFEPVELYTYEWLKLCKKTPKRAYTFWPVEETDEYDGVVLLFAAGDSAVVISHRFGILNRNEDLPEKLAFQASNSTLSFVKYGDLQRHGHSYKHFDSFDGAFYCLTAYWWWLRQVHILDKDPHKLLVGSKVPAPNDKEIAEIENYIGKN